MHLNNFTYRVVLLHSGIFFVGAIKESADAFRSGDEEASDKAFVEAAFSSKPFLVDLARMPEDDLNYVISTILGHTSRQVGSEWMRVYESGALMFDDMTMLDMLQVVGGVLDKQLRPIFASCGLVAIAEEVRAKVSEDGEASREEKTS